jgi:hypothetical protein
LNCCFVDFLQVVPVSDGQQRRVRDPARLRQSGVNVVKLFFPLARRLNKLECLFIASFFIDLDNICELRCRTVSTGEFVQYLAQS